MFLTLDNKATQPARGKQTAHVVDLENLVGETRTPEIVRYTWQHYATEMRILPSDPVFIGCGPRMGRIALFALDTRLRFFIKRGLHGGEEALLEALDPRWLAKRYGHIIVASGDHAFTEWIQQAQQTGAKVDVVARCGSLSRSLLQTCDGSTLFTAPTPRMEKVATIPTQQLGRCAFI